MSLPHDLYITEVDRALRAITTPILRAEVSFWYGFSICSVSHVVGLFTRLKSNNFTNAKSQARKKPVLTG